MAKDKCNTKWSYRLRLLELLVKRTGLEDVPEKETRPNALRCLGRSLSMISFEDCMHEDGRIKGVAKAAANVSRGVQKMSSCLMRSSAYQVDFLAAHVEDTGIGMMRAWA